MEFSKHIYKTMSTLLAIFVLLLVVAAYGTPLEPMEDTPDGENINDGTNSDEIDFDDDM